MQIKFNVFWKKNLGTLYKDNSIDVLGKEAIVDLDLREVSNIHVNFKVNDKSFTDLVEIVDIETSLIRIPFKTDVIKLGTNELELVATMKNGDVKPSQTFTYTVDKSLENPNSVEADTNYPVLIELMDLAGNRLTDMDKSIQKVNTSIENMTNDISNYKEVTTNALNSDISSYKEATTKELEESFNNYSNSTTSNITRVLDNKIVEVDNVVSAKSNELDVKFTTKSNEITKTLNDEINKVDKTLNSEINKVNTTLTNKVNEVDRVLENKVNEVDEALDTTVTTINTELNKKSKEIDNRVDVKITDVDTSLNNKINEVNTSLNNKINEVNEVIEEVELSEQARKEEHTELVNELSSYSSDINNVKDRVDVLEAKVTDNEVIVDLKNKVNNHEERITTSERTIRHQGILLNALNDLDDTISIEEEGTIISLPQSDDGKIIIDELQGNTLVNYCTNGSEELTLNNEINVQGTNVTLTDTVDNSKVDVVCEGNTLVNLLHPSMSSFDRDNTAGGAIALFNGKNLNLIKPSTVYTIISNIQLNTGSQVIINNKEGSASCFEDSIFYENGETGIKVVRATSKPDLSNCSCIIRPYTYQVGRVVGTIMILEGDYTNKPIPSYFEGMKSAFELEDNKVEIISSNSDNTLSNTHSIQLSEPLRGLQNGVCDKFVKQGGKWYVERNCGEAVFNGSEGSWVASSSNGSVATSMFYINQSDRLAQSIGLCDRFSTLSSYGTNESEGIFYGSQFNIRINVDKLKTNDLGGFKEWLQQNPTTIVYELATPTYEEIIDPQVITYLDTTHISTNSTIPCNMQIKNGGYNAIIKPSTLYTVAFDSDKAGEVNIDLGGAKTSTTNNVATITTPSTLTDDTLRLYGKGIKASNVRLLEGDKTNFIPSFFEGMQSSFEDKLQDDGSYKMEILMKNKNLFNINDLEEHSLHLDYYEIINANSFKIRSWANRLYKDVSKILKPNTTYSIKCKATIIEKNDSSNVFEYNVGFGLYNSDTRVVAGFYTDRSFTTLNYSKEINWTFTTPRNLNGFSLLFYTNRYVENGVAKYDTVLVEDLIITEHNLEYEQGLSNKIQLQLNEPLRAVGDVKDRFVLKDGKLMVERNCGIREYQEGDFELDNTLTDKTNTTYILNEPTYEEVSYETQKLILECYENGTLFIDTLIPPTVSVTYSANKPVVSKLNKVNEVTEINTEDIAITQMAVDFLLMSTLGEEMINFKIKGGTNMSAYFASRIIKGALKYEDVISKYPNYKEDIDLILIAEGYSDLIVEL